MGFDIYNGGNIAIPYFNLCIWLWEMEALTVKNISPSSSSPPRPAKREEYCLRSGLVVVAVIHFYTATGHLPQHSVRIGGSRTFAADAQSETLVLDNELQNLSLERKTESTKAKIKKPISVSQFKPETWMLPDEDQDRTDN